ncbi:MAG: PilN domain-containing protein [Brevinematia bacterium]
MGVFRKFFYFVLEYLGVIEVTFQIRSSDIIVGVFLNYLFGKRVLNLILGQLVDRNRMEFSIQRFIEKNVNIPVYVANLILPSEMFVNKVISVPISARKKLHNIVISNIESIGIFDISSLSYGYKVVGKYRVKDRVFLKVLISAIRQSFVNEYVNYFKSLGISIREVLSATIGNINVFTDISSVGAVSVIFNKQNEVFLSIISGKNVIKLEVIEVSDKNVLENYIVSFISEFVKERSLFLEKIILFYFDNDFVERIFDKVNIITLSGELLPEYKLLNDNYLYLDVISYSKTNGYKVNVLTKPDYSKVRFDIILFRVSFFLTVFSIIGLFFVLSTRDEVNKYLLVKKGIEERTESISPEIQRYIEVMEIKKKVDYYEKLISSFYKKFGSKSRHFYIMFDVFKSLDSGTWLKEVEFLPKSIKIKGFSSSDTSLYNTVKNLSDSDRFYNVNLTSVYETYLGNDKVFKFEIEIKL